MWQPLGMSRLTFLSIWYPLKSEFLLKFLGNQLVACSMNSKFVGRPDYAESTY